MWSSMRVALERVEGVVDEDNVSNALKVVKTIGLLNLFGSGKVKMSRDLFRLYAQSALGIDNVDY